MNAPISEQLLIDGTETQPEHSEAPTDKIIYDTKATADTSKVTGRWKSPADDDWRWWFNPPNSDVIVVPHADATAVYPNENGSVVIRQQHPDACVGNDDMLVILTPEAARKVATAVLELVEQLEGGAV